MKILLRQGMQLVASCCVQILEGSFDAVFVAFLLPSDCDKPSKVFVTR